jgi:hypothetical protein
MRRKKERSDALTEIVIEDEMPLLVVEGSGFQKFMRAV